MQLLFDQPVKFIRSLKVCKFSILLNRGNAILCER